MTYCVGLRLEQGLVFMSDTCTNAGLDDISMFKKMHTWTVPGERVITIMTAGNLATTQAVVSILKDRTKAIEDRKPTILELPSMFEVARLIGATMREEIQQNAGSVQTADSAFNASIIVGGQIKGCPPQLFMVYPEGNFIEASDETPYMQIGETKYGRPILVRAYDRKMSFEDAVKLLLVSFDSTIKANLSVAMPADLLIYKTDSFEIFHEQRITAEDDYFKSISSGWGEALKQAFQSLPDFRI